MESNFDAAKRFVSYGLTEREAGRRESASGPGSSLKSTKEIRQLIFSAIKDLNVKSILDLGCGDWNWMEKVMSSPKAANIQYTGWDVHEEMINVLTNQFGSLNVQFMVKDVFQEEIPPVDLVICRDVLFHVDIQLAVKLVNRIQSSSSRFFLSTTFPDEPQNDNISPYLPIKGWGFHRINLDLPPFDIASKVISSVEEPLCSKKGKKRYVNLYDFTNDKI